MSDSLRHHGLWSLPGSSVHEIFQAGVLEWVAISFSKGSFWPRDRTWLSHLAGRQTLYCLSHQGSPDLHNHHGMVPHLESDILGCEVKWGLLQTKLVKVIEFLLKFQNIKDDTVISAALKCQQIWETQQWPQDWKRSVFIPVPKKDNDKECSDYHTVALISHASKAMLKIL